MHHRAARIALVLGLVGALLGCAVDRAERGTEPAETLASASPVGGELPEFDDSAQGTPGAWGRLTDERSGASFVFPEAVAPVGPKGFVGADGTDFVMWYYEFTREELALRVELLGPVGGDVLVLPPRSALRRSTARIRDLGGRDIDVKVGRTRRRGGVVEVSYTVEWKLDGERQFTRLGIFNSHGMAAVLFVTLSDEDRRYARHSVSYAYHLMSHGIDVPTRAPKDLAPVEAV